MKTATSSQPYLFPVKPDCSPSVMESVFNTLHEGVFIYDLQQKE